jgi:hypothetical protein
VASQRAERLAKQTVDSGVSTPSVSNSSLCSSDEMQDKDVNEINNYRNVMAKKYNLNSRRHGSILMDERNLDLELMMADNPVIIFPSKHVTAWDHLPRF